MAADRYSYAIVLWELLTRLRPYEGFPGASAVRAIGPLIIPLWASEGVRPAIPDHCPKQVHRLYDARRLNIGISQSCMFTIFYSTSLFI